MPVDRRAFRIIGVALLAGLLTGIVASAFHGALDQAQQFRGVLAAHAHGWPVLGLPAIVLGTAAAAILARTLVRRFSPIAAGSGIQHVEAVVNGRAAPAGAAVIPVKFFGGILAIGAGLALGREGPTVQMGATIGSLCANRLLPEQADRVAIHAASAGAGLAVAFNAPIGGCMFVFEELIQHLTRRLMATVLVTTAVAITVTRAIYGYHVELTVPSFGPAPMLLLPAFLLLGLLLGLLGAAYSSLTLGLLQITDRLRAVPPLVQTGLIGGGVGLLVWFAPALAGSGEELTATVLAGHIDLAVLAIIFAVRFAVGPASYAARTPGGLFMPLLMVGAASGALFAGLAGIAAPESGWQVSAFAVCGMAGLFAAVIRAPLTGIVLVIEMTGRADLSLAIVIVSAAATLTAQWIGSTPIYDSLGERMTRDPALASLMLRPAGPAAPAP